MVLENFLNAHYENNIDISVVTNAAHYLRGKSDSEELRVRADVDRLRREGAAGPQGRALRSRPSCRAAGRAFIKETERAISELGLKGVFIHSSHKGHYPDDDEARPFWELVQDLDVPVMIHPPHVGFGEERMHEYRLASSIGRPFDLCLALGRLIVRGILEDFPKLKLVASHGGGGICETISRMDYAYELQDEAFFLGSYKPMKIKHKPSEYMKMLYIDTVTYNAPAVKMVLEWIGPDRSALRQRRAAAHLAQAARHQADPGSRHSRGRQGEDLLEQCAPAFEAELIGRDEPRWRVGIPPWFPAPGQRSLHPARRPLLFRCGIFPAFPWRIILPGPFCELPSPGRTSSEPSRRYPSGSP